MILYAKFIHKKELYMSKIKLNNEQTSQLLASYENALRAVREQSNNSKDDIELLNHMIANVQFIQWTWENQLPSNKFSWKVMTSVGGSPQVLNSTKTYPLQYDTTKTINQNIQSLYDNLLLNNAEATEDLKSYVNRNTNIEFTSLLLAFISLILAELVAPWSAWGVPFLIPLFSTLAGPLIVMAMLSSGIGIVAGLHSSTLNELYLKHKNLEEFSDNTLHKAKTAKFFQPNHSNNLSERLEQSFELPQFN